MHYVDEGPSTGRACVLLHGNPTWSYLFRKLIGPLAADGNRVISVDHLGFGRSAVPDRPEFYTIERHSTRLASLLDSLRLRDVTLVVHDWGGPIGLPSAARRPDAIRGLFLLNTFAPTLPGPMGERPSIRMLRSRLLGPALVKGRNVPTERFLFKAGTTHPEAFDETIKEAYRTPHSARRSRTPMLVFPREIPFSTDHPVAKSMNSTSEALKAQMSGKPVAIVWGTADVLFGEDVLGQWHQVFPHASVRRLSDSGHFVPEDAPQQLLSDLRDFAHPE
jgi:pimeloyl-ACP methyl ester carboxylesterase